jgi:hypothetical protein
MSIAELLQRKQSHWIGSVGGKINFSEGLVQLFLLRVEIPAGGEIGGKAGFGKR